MLAEGCTKHGHHHCSKCDDEARVALLKARIEELEVYVQFMATRTVNLSYAEQIGWISKAQKLLNRKGT